MLQQVDQMIAFCRFAPVYWAGRPHV